MIQPFPVFCRDCAYSLLIERTKELRCTHPKVNANVSWVLAAFDPTETVLCQHERERPTALFGSCGKRGKLWEPKS